MEPKASISFLALLLLGLSQAVPLMEPQQTDITTVILTTNNGSRELLVEGDIVLQRIRNARVCHKNKCFWNKSSTGVVLVPYTVSNAFSASKRSIIAGAMATFHNKTCIRFVPRSNQTDYISIESRDGCYSSVGRKGGMQVVSLNNSSCIFHGIAQHELNHALGFYHEHTRSDRDNYVRINWENIKPSMSSNFNKENTNNLHTKYDYSSVMHYARTAFSINGQDTITPIRNSSVQIGQRVKLSAIDVLRINTVYNCSYFNIPSRNNKVHSDVLVKVSEL